jgi:hypothetical protein
MSLLIYCFKNLLDLLWGGLLIVYSIFKFDLIKSILKSYVSLQEWDLFVLNKIPPE